MKKTILSVLKADKSSIGCMTEKQLRKLVKKECSNSDDREFDKDTFCNTLQLLITKGKIVSHEDGSLSIAGKDSSSKIDATAVKDSTALTNDTNEDNGASSKRKGNDNSNEHTGDVKRKKHDDNKKQQESSDTNVSSSSSNGRSSSQDKRKQATTIEGDQKSAAYVTRAGVVVEELWKNGEKFWRENTLDAEYLRKNPDGVTRLFCGNLNKAITAEQLHERIPDITFIKWITDKQTGDFYGSSFIELKDPAAAAFAVMQDRTKFLGRPLKLYYCPPRPGDVWPPRSTGRENPSRNNSNHGNNNGTEASQQQQPPRREKTPKPPGCKKLYMGNLSYNIDDDAILDFFKDCGGEVVGLRWLTRQGSEEFRGCGFIEFDSTEVADEAFKLDNKELLGRNIRLDWTN